MNAVCRDSKRIAGIIFILFFCMIGCSSSRNSNENTIESYFQKHDPLNKGETQIFLQKSFKDDTLILTEKYSGDGHTFTNLFLLDKDKKILKVATGHTPLSMCFTVNAAEYDGCKILFGSFNDSKWLIEPDKKESVDIKSIYIRFKNGEAYNEKAGKGYIVYSKEISDVEVFELYDDNGKLQSDLNDLQRYGEVIIDTSLEDIEQ
ncbi:hypothetical protein [Desulfitobacterium sp. AusDCA]|uniref:hypothetical protein n=1 Tax=Desulfitobacterium sp. AusDCA TaxID=3240383 RepID=UPI003DA7481B